MNTYVKRFDESKDNADKLLNKLESMISYGKFPTPKCYTGKQIKKVIKDLLAVESYLNPDMYIAVINTFNNTYIEGQYPISDKSMYYLKWDWNKLHTIKDVLKCYKVKEEKKGDIKNGIKKSVR